MYVNMYHTCVLYYSTVVFSSQLTKEEISMYKDSVLGVMSPIQTRKFSAASDLLWFDSVKNSANKVQGTNQLVSVLYLRKYC